ncbi:MAG TPA: ABC transporter ATP-binding protein [Aggregatilineales bacterium]|nr:ABC transporter ATP-binding protein [Anaerolineales bacterium]HRE48728.1 ABC transporter ATP-binding protein [Aggregatilineales bacterium]
MVTESPVILEGRNLRKEFGGLIAVEDVSIRVQRGTTHAIIGPNGAGKTTLFNLIGGRYRPTAGTVIFNGRDVTHLPVYRRVHVGMGRSFQITNLFPTLTVMENVRLAAQARGADNLRFLRRADSFTIYMSGAREVLGLVGLGDALNVPANALPHGGKRKLELAILLAADPDLLLLDEPTAGMASESVPELLHIIDTVRRESNKTILLVEHNMQVVMNLADTITVMAAGRILAEGTPAEIAANKTVQEVYLGTLYDAPSAPEAG